MRFAIVPVRRLVRGQAHDGIQNPHGDGPLLPERMANDLILQGSQSNDLLSRSPCIADIWKPGLSGHCGWRLGMDGVAMNECRLAFYVLTWNRVRKRR